MALTRLQQLAMRAEGIEGTFVDPFTAAGAAYLAVDPQLTFEVETYNRDIARESFTPLSPLAGAVLGSCSFGLEMTARNTTYTAGASNLLTPSFDLPLRACGFQRYDVYKVTIPTGSISATLPHGTLVQQTTSTATATVIGTYYSNSTSQDIWIAKGLGFTSGSAAGTLGNQTAFDASTGWTFNSGVANFTSSAVTPAVTGLAWVPTSVALYRMNFTTAANYAGGTVFVGATNGGIAVSIPYAVSASRTSYYVRRIKGTFANNEVVTPYVAGVAGTNNTIPSAGTNFLQEDTSSPSLSLGISKDGIRESLAGARGTVSISGTIGEPVLFNFNFSGIKNAVVDAGAVAGVTFNDRVPSVLLGATMSAGDSAGTTVPDQRSFCANTFGIDAGNDIQYRRCITAATGIDGIYINGRTPTATLDPEQSPELDFDWMANFFSSGSLRLDVVVGSGADKFRFKINSMSLTSVGQGDRNGIITRDLAFGLHSGSTASTAGDNEMTVIWDPTT